MFDVCIIQDCDNIIIAKNLCKKHYRQKWNKENLDKKRTYARKDYLQESVERKKKKSGYRRKHSLKKNYNLSLQDFQTMVSTQNNKCAICGEKEKGVNKYGEPRSLSVDHCHTTYTVRGLLCSRCNLVLGKINDDINLLIKMAHYLDLDKTL